MVSKTFVGTQINSRQLVEFSLKTLKKEKEWAYSKCQDNKTGKAFKY